MNEKKGKSIDLKEAFITLESATIEINKLLAIICESEQSKLDWKQLALFTHDPVASFVNEILDNGLEKVRYTENGEPF